MRLCFATTGSFADRSTCGAVAQTSRLRGVHGLVQVPGVSSCGCRAQQVRVAARCRLRHLRCAAASLARPLLGTRCARRALCHGMTADLCHCG